MKKQNLLIFVFLVVLRFTIQAIAYLLAPFVAIIRAIYVNTLMFSTKILHDIFPPRIGIATFDKDGNESPQVMQSKCCDSGIQAKMEFGRIKYFYCSKCHAEVDMDEVMKEKNNNN